MPINFVPGQWVKAKAGHVTDKSECGRRFGPGGHNKEVYGVVLELVSLKATKTGRASNGVKAEYDRFGGYKKVQTINV